MKIERKNEIHHKNVNRNRAKIIMKMKMNRMENQKSNESRKSEH